MSLTAIPLPRVQVLRAGRALAKLLEDPDDLPQVFTIIESMSGTAIHRLLLGFRFGKAGKKLLEEQPDLGAILADRARLRAMPDGSLGRAYLAFVEAEGISAEGIREASAVGRQPADLNRSFRFVRDRMRDTHDLWHAVTGYKGDVLGELALLAFGLAHNWNFAIAAIVVAGILKGYGTSDVGMIADGYRRGRNTARWFPALAWEEMLERPLEEVRRELGVEAVPAYVPLRTTELRAQGIIPA